MANLGYIQRFHGGNDGEGSHGDDYWLVTRIDENQLMMEVIF